MIEENNPNGGSPTENEVVGDTSPAETELHAVEVPFALPEKTMKFIPCADFIQLDVPVTKDEGGIIVPGVAKSASLITAKVLAKGPRCEQVKEGDIVLMMASGIMGGAAGSIIDGRRVYFTQEKYLLSVVDAS